MRCPALRATCLSNGAIPTTTLRASLPAVFCWSYVLNTKGGTTQNKIVLRMFRVDLANGAKITNRDGFEIIYPSFRKAIEAAEKYVKIRRLSYLDHINHMDDKLLVPVKRLQERTFAYPKLAEMVAPFGETMKLIRSGQVIDFQAFSEYINEPLEMIEAELKIIRHLIGLERTAFISDEAYRLYFEERKKLPISRRKFVNKLHEFKQQEILKDKDLVFLKVLDIHKNQPEFLNYLNFEERHAMRLIKSMLSTEEKLSSMEYYIERVEIDEE